MLILVLLFAFARLNTEGAPVDTSAVLQCYCDAVDLYIRDNPTSDNFGVRRRNDIIVSCLATIFACTWTTIHPNIPAPNESGWESLKKRVVIMIYALLAPEAITAWAMRQYFSARWIAKRFNRDFIEETKRPSERGPLFGRITDYMHEWMHGSPLPMGLEEGEIRPWSITHGFLLQMGGFMQCNQGKLEKTYTLYYWLKTDIQEKIIDAPTITEAEIQDRSKGDILSRTLVILQTTWFIVQCIVRWSAKLPVTELEVVTLGFAMLNALTYGFWWNKPQSVGIPVYLETKKRSGKEPMPAQVKEAREIERSTTQPVTTTEPEAAVAVAAEKYLGEEKTPIWDAVQEPSEGEPRRQRSFFIRQIHTHGWQLLWMVPYVLVLTMLRPLGKLLRFTSVDPSFKLNLRVRMFHTDGSVEDDETVYLASSFIAILFGLVHFIPAWFLDFPSQPEMFLWRISAAIIIGQPIILGVWSKWTKGKLWEQKYKSSLLGIAVLSGVLLYIIARIIILILAFLSLRHLSSDSLVAINWISFLPHL